MSQTSTDNPFISNADIQRAMQHAVDESGRAMQRGEMGKTEKLFGFWEVDASLAAGVNGAWNVVVGQILPGLKPRAHEIISSGVDKVGIKGTNANRTIAGAMMALDVGLAGSKNIAEIVQTHRRHFNENASMARKLAPALDRLMGGHSMLAYRRVGKDPLNGGNEVIWAHRKRSNQRADMENAGNYLAFGINVVPIIAPQLGGYRQMWNGTYKTGESESQASSAEKPVGITVAGTAAMLGQSLAGPLAIGIKRSNEQKLKQNQQACSSLELIQNLQQQVEYDPKSRGFQLPKVMGNRSVSLEEYIVVVLDQHQKVMADLDPEHSELRPALNEDKQAAAKVVANAMRQGEIDANALIHLVGEQRIIKNRGRAIADANDVLHEVEKISGIAQQPSMQPKEFYQDVSFTKEQFVEAAKQLEGEERQRLLALAPDEVLKDAGVSDKEIQSIRAETKKTYDTILTEALLGLAAESDVQLKKEGMPTSQIKLLRKLESEILTKGEEAVITSKQGRAHALDAEKLVLDFAVPQVIGDKAYLGALVAKGAQRLHEQDETLEDAPRTGRHGSHREREHSRRMEAESAEDMVRY